ncbi:DUF397 domain-containing protein [Yinghuangia seranimata]|uniref:DUF397 domain-containing protein n=1 Tax=Yinghuangia seranimata TaxID=408067 RepID=UPI00248BAA87|nr:DUF397 domain-containing protein [Yinghuangia seranimata]MDI2125602.1 DUF397 domain-containing protein [Yinghuangia seranimata]
MNTNAQARTFPSAWIKSSYSSDEGGECVEVRALSDVAQVRDSKVAAGPRLAFPVGAWAEFVGRAARD